MAPGSSSIHSVKRIPYRYPWAIYIPTVVLFGLLNYLVLGTVVSEDGSTRVLPAYVETLQRQRPDALLTRAALMLEKDVMGGLFFVGRRVFGGMTGVQVVWVVAWIIHFFELGMCVRICLACHASAWTMFRYCFCTVTAGFAQLVPLQQARAAYLGEGTKSSSSPARRSTKKAPSPSRAHKQKKSQ